MDGKIPRSPHLITLANEPRMVREMLHRALDAIPGVIVVEQTGDLSKLVDVFQQVQVDWLVVTLDEEHKLPRQANLLLNRMPALSVLALSFDGSRVEVCVKTAKRGLVHYGLQDVSLMDLVRLLHYKYGDQEFPPALM